ncbi:MAG TPA: DUF1080 domain-containing protein [Planctomycetaceae bacterium]|nr:DUF1080 domain-containing protein [Planctomycetaceae bacterium]
MKLTGLVSFVFAAIWLALPAATCAQQQVPGCCRDDSSKGSRSCSEAGFVSLFDGKSLHGWHGDPTLWKVQDGVIVGQTDGKIPHNTFLIHERTFSDFVLKVEFRLHGHRGNSGIQFRSQEHDDFVVSGYQADIADNQFMGILYGERTGRGIIANVTPEVKKALEKAIHKDGWNQYVITARGDHIVLELNGVKTVDIRDPDGPRSGIIALQLHRGHNMTISFRNIRIKTWKPTAK